MCAAALVMTSIKGVRYKIEPRALTLPLVASVFELEFRLAIKVKEPKKSSHVTFYYAGLSEAG